MVLVIAVGALWAAVAAVVVALCILSGRSDRSQDTAEFEPIELARTPLELSSGLAPGPR